METYPKTRGAIVRVAGDGDGASWERYVSLHPAATVFHRWQWRQVLSNSFKYACHYLIAERNGRVVGLLPLAEVKTWLFGHALVSLPFCSWAGPLTDDREALASLDEASAALADLVSADYVEYRHQGELFPGRPVQDLYVYFVRNIASDHDANMRAIPRKQRAMVRKGIASGLSSAIEPVVAFFPLYRANVHRHGTPGCPRRFFDAMASAFGDDCEILVVRNASGLAVSAVLSLYFRDEVLPFYAGDLPEARALAANDFKYWQLMCRAADRGASRFNYGRSKRDTGSYAFKKNWGFEPQPLSYEFRLGHGRSVPQNNPTNPKFRLAIETWRRLPAWFVGAAGPLIVRGLG